VEFDFNIRDDPSAINVSTGSVVTISNVKRFCGPSYDMLMPLPALIELNVRLLLNTLNVILAVSVFDDTNDEVEPSAIRYCEEVPPLLTIELAVIVPDAVRFVKPLILLLFIARLAATDNAVPFNVIFALPDPPTCQAKLESLLLYIILPRKSYVGSEVVVGIVKSIYCIAVEQISIPAAVLSSKPIYTPAAVGARG
jgi:hypothetical protein